MKSHLNAIFKDIFEEWPIAPSADKLQQYSYYCTNKSGFQPLFLHMLDRHIRVFENQRGEEAQHLKSFKANISVCIADHSLFCFKILRVFDRHILMISFQGFFPTI